MDPTTYSARDDKALNCNSSSVKAKRTRGRRLELRISLRYENFCLFRSFVGRLVGVFGLFVCLVGWLVAWLVGPSVGRLDDLFS